jgi:uroporphyrin-III C-methyltransferase
MSEKQYNSFQNIPLGKVYLVGAGPGDPGLFTLKGKALLEMADVVVHDALVSSEILTAINPKAEVIHAGKRRGRHSLLQEDTTRILITKAREHAVVVRLKGGDPFVFGRGGEEMQDLLEAGIPVEVVPGVTAGVAAPAYAGIPVTHRNYSSSVTFVTGHEAAGKYRPKVNWRALAAASETIVIYMGVRNLPYIISELKAGGLSGSTPVAAIRWGTTPASEQLVSTLDAIVTQMEATGFEAPAIIAIGAVANLHEILSPIAQTFR